jgi:exopolysaccharide biosynthesis polyprenyl glycosylphosphotransferase
MLPRPVLTKIWKTALLSVIDFLSVIIGTVFVYKIRYSWTSTPTFPAENALRGLDYLFVSIAVATLIVVTYAILGLYKLKNKTTLWSLSIKLAFGIFTIIVPTTFFYLLFANTSTSPLQGVTISRQILATVGFSILASIYFGRLFFWAVEQLLYYYDVGRNNVILIGPETQEIAYHLSSKPEIGKIITYSSLSQKNLNQIELLIEKGEVSEVYLYSDGSEIESKLANICERRKVLFLFVPAGFSKFSAFSMEPAILGDELFLEIKHTKLDGWLVVVKRLLDIFFAGIFLIVFSPIYFLIALAIKLDSRGSILYKNERVGPNGEVFNLYKFRRFKQEFCTTQDNQTALEIEKKLIKKQNLKADSSPLYKISDDPRMTKVGKLLEKTSLDELPQFFNVLLGNMSVVGPRPHQPREVAKYKSHHFKVLNIKPGITGFAQVNGRSDLTFEREVYFDTYYIEHWSLILDLKIILMTPIILFKRHKS